MNNVNGGGVLPQSVEPPQGARRPMYNEQGQPLAVTAPQPGTSYPNIPPPVQPSAPHSPIQLGPAPLEEVPVQHQALVLDAFHKGATIVALLEHFKMQGVFMTENAIKRLAVQYNMPIWSGTAWENYGAPAQQPVQPVAAVAAPAAAPQAASSAQAVRTRLKDADKEKVRALHAAGKDSTAIAHELGFSPDAVMRVLKKLAKEAAGVPAPSSAPTGAAQPASAPVPLAQYVGANPGLAAAQDVVARAMALQIGQVVPGAATERPQEDTILRGRGLMLDWIGTGWMVCETPEAKAERGTNPHPAVVEANAWVAGQNAASGAGEGVQADDVIDIVVDYANPIGSWLSGVEQKVNEKLAKLNLRARIVLDLAR